MAKNLTQGRPAKLIFFFALPLFIGNLFQQIYNMADTLIVGRTIGVTALAGVGSTGSLLFLVLGFVMGMTSGFSIVTAQFFGACNKVGVRRSFCAAKSPRSSSDCALRNSYVNSYPHLYYTPKTFRIYRLCS